MSISFVCPHCGFRKTVADHYAGQSGNCAQCGQLVTIPAAPEIVGSYRPPKKNSGIPIVLAIVAVVLICPCLVGLPVAMILPAIQMARQAARRQMTENDLRLIGLALVQYSDENGVFPAASFSDPNTNRPLYSWRVAILKDLDPKLFNEYDFTKPWDHPDNLRLESRMPDFYRNPQVELPPYHTNYLAVVGPKTVMGKNRFTRPEDIKDGTSNTVMIVEAAKAVHWMQPTDLDFETMSFEINASPSSPGFPGDIGKEATPGRTPAGIFADGAVRPLDRLGMDPDLLKSAFVIDDGK